MTTRATERAALHALAAAWGVQRAHRGNDGARRVASDDALLAVLNALGVELSGPGDAPARLADRRATLAARPIEPVLVAWDGRLPGFDVVLGPRARHGRRLRCHLALEDGTTRTHDAAAGDGRTARIALPGALPLGVHRLAVEGAALGAETYVVSAPRRAWTPAGAPRDWGVFTPLHALRSARSLGIGDFGDLRRIVDWVGGAGGRLVGTLPMLAAFLDEPFEPSPYAPVSRLFWNEIHLDLGSVPELADAPAVRRRLASQTTRDAFARLRRGRLVDLREVMRLKRALLGALAATPLRPERARAFAAFLAANPQVRDYARYRAAVEARGTTWHGWRGPARAGRLAARDVDPGRVQHHCYVQWLADQQLRAVGEAASPRTAGLYLDLPLGVHGGGYDTWRERDAFAFGVDAGAPPDAFFARGQSWGFPPLHPERVRASGYRHPRAYLRHHMRVARMLRIDHVMGLHRLYWVPQGFPATDGVYVRQHAAEQYALLTLESHRHECEIVGENLGTVPANVNAAMDRHGLLRMYVLPFEIDPCRRPALAVPPATSLACLGTHDLPPFAGWLAGRDLDDAGARGLFSAETLQAERGRRATMRRALVEALRNVGEITTASPDPARLLAACLRQLGGSPARIVLASLDDLWLEEAPQNVPGTTSATNWRRRLRLGVERFTTDPTVRTLLADLDGARRLRRPRGVRE